MFVLLVRVLAGSAERREGEREGGMVGGREWEKEREDYTHEQDDLLC